MVGRTRDHVRRVIDDLPPQALLADDAVDIATLDAVGAVHRLGARDVTSSTTPTTLWKGSLALPGSSGGVALAGAEHQIPWPRLDAVHREELRAQGEWPSVSTGTQTSTVRPRSRGA